MAPMLYHGLAAFGLPIVCIESRQAYQALKSLATHKTDAMMRVASPIWPAAASSSRCT